MYIFCQHCCICNLYKQNLHMNLSYKHKYTCMLYVHQPVSKRETSALTKKILLYLACEHQLAIMWLSQY